MNWFFIAGEASGDLHGGNLAKAIFELDDVASIKGWGGEKMESAGVDLKKHYKETAIMGFVEILTKLPKLFANLNLATQQILHHSTDAVVLIDYSGFNLRLAKRLRKEGFSGKIFYYISPKLWVWNKKRVKQIIHYVDAVYCILPFEAEWYKEHGYNHAVYIGNPLMDEISAFTPNEHFTKEHQLTTPYVALLPGSRKNEILHILPVMIEVANSYSSHQFVIAGVDSVREEIEAINQNQLPIIYDNTYQVVHFADAALVTSGTATLEVALLGTPELLLYKANKLSFWIAKQVTNLNFIGLPNLIMEKEIVPELIQQDMQATMIKEKLDVLLQANKTKHSQVKNFEELQKKVGLAGASKNAAKHMIMKLN